VVWPFRSACDQFSSYTEGLWESLRRETRDSGMRALIAPIEPFNRSRVIAPVIAAAGVVGLLVFSGIALSAIATAAAALAAVYFLLTQVFGYEISLIVPAPSS
jgi:hypothetical protein